VIEAQKATYTVKRMCELLEVSRSGFYKWRVRRDRGPTPSQRRRAGLDGKVAASHAASNGVYGAPRVLADLRAAGTRVSRKTVAASLRRQRLAGICPRRFAPATTVVDLDAQLPKDLVRRRFDTGELDRVWTSDITYLRTGQGWLYLCAVRDGCSRRVIGWAIDEHLRTDLVTSALSMAVAMRGELAETVILHADRGCQYTSGQLSRFAHRHNLARSVGRTGVCWDNAAAESFWATLQVEFYRSTPVAQPSGRQARCRRLDRAGLQPAQAPLSPRYDHPGRIREPIQSDGTSRLTLCLPNGASDWNAFIARQTDAMT
jgi:putative transposase